MGAQVPGCVRTKGTSANISKSWALGHDSNAGGAHCDMEYRCLVSLAVWGPGGGIILYRYALELNWHTQEIGDDVMVEPGLYYAGFGNMFVTYPSTFQTMYLAFTYARSGRPMVL